MWIKADFINKVVLTIASRIDIFHAENCNCFSLFKDCMMIEMMIWVARGTPADCMGVVGGKLMYESLVLMALASKTVLQKKQIIFFFK